MVSLCTAKLSCSLLNSIISFLAASNYVKHVNTVFHISLSTALISTASGRKGCGLVAGEDFPKEQG
jgi:hypothetical protein